MENGKANAQGMLTLNDIKRIARDNYDRGGDWITEGMLSDSELARLFVGKSKSKLYSHFEAVSEMRDYFRGGRVECIIAG